MRPMQVIAQMGLWTSGFVLMTLLVGFHKMYT